MTATAAALSPTTRMGAVSLTVADLPRARDFYRDALGLTAADPAPGDGSPGGSVTMTSEDGTPLVVLHEDRAAPARDPRAPGLFHLAILLPTRADLGRALARLATGGRRALDGASDHLVSEALYLSDPEGNGIELYRDRPRREWPHDGDGALRMVTLPLDLRDLLAAVEPGTAGSGSDSGSSPGARMPAGSRIGHVHLQVSDIPRAEAFYAGLIGLEPTVRGYPGAVFASAGGYHHHLGMNTWHSAGSPPVPPGTAGLREFEIVVGDRSELATVADRLRAADVPVPSAAGEDRGDDAVRVRDPFGSTVVLRAA